MTDKELQELYNSTETGSTEIIHQMKPEEKQNFLSSDFDANAGDKVEPATQTQTQEPANENDDPDVQKPVQEPANVSEPATQTQTQTQEHANIKTLDDVYKTIDYIEQSRIKQQKLLQEEQLRVQQEEELKKKKEEEANRPFESSLTKFNYDNKIEYTEDEKNRMKEIESVYGNDLEDYMKLKMRSYENKFVEMIKFIEKNQNEGLTKSINQYHNDNNTKLSSIEEYVKQQQVREYQAKLEDNAKVVREKHADFEDGNLRNDLAKWIYNEQTDAIDQQRLILLSQSDQPKHVIELLDKYKEARGIVKQNISTTTQTPNVQQQEEEKRKAQEEKERIAKGLQSNNSTRASQPDTSGRKTLEELYKSMNI